MRALAATAAVLGLAVVLWLTGSERAAAFTLLLLVVLSAIGVFALLAALTGVLRVAGEDPTPGFVRSVLDGAGEGIAVTTGTGRVIYADPAMRARVRPELDLCAIDQAFRTVLIALMSGTAVVSVGPVLLARVQPRLSRAFPGLPRFRQARARILNHSGGRLGRHASSRGRYCGSRSVPAVTPRESGTAVTK